MFYNNIQHMSDTFNDLADLQPFSGVRRNDDICQVMKCIFWFLRYCNFKLRQMLATPRKTVKRGKWALQIVQNFQFQHFECFPFSIPLRFMLYSGNTLPISHLLSIFNIHDDDCIRKFIFSTSALKYKTSIWKEIGMFGNLFQICDQAKTGKAI